MGCLAGNASWAGGPTGRPGRSRPGAQTTVQVILILVFRFNMAVICLREHSIIYLINKIYIIEYVWNHLSVFFNTDSYLYCFCTDTFPFYFFKGYFWLLKTAQDFLFGFNYDLQGAGSFIKKIFYSSIKMLAGRMVAFFFTIFFLFIFFLLLFLYL